jgi:hypothetical protein
VTTVTAVLDDVEIPDYQVPVEHIGPVWEPNPDWDGVSLIGKRGKYILPEFTLGFQAWSWVRGYPDEDGKCLPMVLSPDSSDDDPEAFAPTFEQYRFILWWYAVDKRGRWMFRRGVLQRLKGWGKDPIAGVISLIELAGPCRFRGWSKRDLPKYGYRADGKPVIRRGDPVGEDNPNAWIQVAAVTKTQTQNTMLLFPSLISPEFKRHASMRADSIGVTKVTAFRGRRQIQAVTSNPKALEGGRPSLVIANETEHWIETNRGWEMDAAIDRNAGKSKGGAARRLSICNAPEPSEESVGLRERNAYLAEVEGTSMKTGVLYDSLEIPEHIDLMPTGIEHLEPEEQEPFIMAWIMAIVRTCRGDSFWLDPERIALEILDRKVPSTSIARRFYLNQTIASDDASFDPKAVDAAVDIIAALQRGAPNADPIRCGWDPVRPDEPVVMFFDGSKSDDGTALVGCRISDGYCFTIGVWQPPAQKRRRQLWLAPRSEVDRRVEEAFDRFNIIGFWADPSHAKDDEDGASYWDGLIDEWHRRYSEDLDEKYWATKTGHGSHSILWDMSSPLHTKQIVEATERVTAELERKNEEGEYEPAFVIDGNPRLKEHLKNCRRAPGQYGVGVRKESRESLKKIDAAVCLIGARMLRRIVMNSPVEEKSSGGWAYTA